MENLLRGSLKQGVWYTMTQVAANKERVLMSMMAGISLIPSPMIINAVAAGIAIGLEIGTSTPMLEDHREVGAEHGADVYVGLAETCIAGIPGIEDCRSLSVWGFNGMVKFYDEELPRVAPHEQLDTELCNAARGPFEKNRPSPVALMSCRSNFSWSNFKLQ